VGTKVTWYNTGTQPHTATSPGNFNTGIIPPGGSASVVMNQVGTIKYSCIPHPWMIGEIIVTPV
jgi:plastocyanin